MPPSCRSWTSSRPACVRFGRLARLGLVALKSPAVKNLLRRLGVPALVVAVAVFVAAGIVRHAEGPPEYSTYGESVWWAMVTVTAVGYGDIVPKTARPRSDPLEGVQRSLDDVREELAALRAALGETEPPRRR